MTQLKSRHKKMINSQYSTRKGVQHQNQKNPNQYNNKIILYPYYRAQVKSSKRTSVGLGMNKLELSGAGNGDVK